MATEAKIAAREKRRAEEAAAEAEKKANDEALKESGEDAVEHEVKEEIDGDKDLNKDDDDEDYDDELPLEDEDDDGGLVKDDDFGMLDDDEPSSTSHNATTGDSLLEDTNANSSFVYMSGEIAEAHLELQKQEQSSAQGTVNMLTDVAHIFFYQLTFFLSTTIF